MIAVLMPTTRPRLSASGPPELPGLSGAVCCTTPSISRPSLPRSDRPSADTTPADTVDAKPSGLPMATTSCPGRSGALISSAGAGAASATGSAWSSARSVAGSLPTTRAAVASPAGARTRTSRAPSMTWWFDSR